MKPALVTAPNAVYSYSQTQSFLLKLKQGGEEGEQKKKANKWEFSRISKQSNQRATFRTSHLGSETPSCPGVPAEPAAKHSSWRSCHWLQAIREDALATNVQSMINLFLFILMLLQLQQMFKCLLAVTYPRMVLNPYQASNDKSHRFLGLCQLEWFFFSFPSGKFCIFSGSFLGAIWCVHALHLFCPTVHMGGSESWEKFPPLQGYQPGASQWRSSRKVI